MSAMTEEEARSNWCPATRDRPRFADAPSDLPAPEDYCGDMAAAQPCLGSRCMAWRWAGPERDITVTNNGEPPDGDGWTAISQGFPPGFSMIWERPRLNRRGYCGLAGVPTP